MSCTCSLIAAYLAMFCLACLVVGMHFALLPEQDTDNTDPFVAQYHLKSALDNFRQQHHPFDLSSNDFA